MPSLFPRRAVKTAPSRAKLARRRSAVGKPIDSQEKVARAALAVIDAKGLEGFNLQLVARKLGIRSPSLYHHFQSRSDILREVARIVLEDTFATGIVESADWRECIVCLQVAARRSLLQHSRAMPLMLQFYPRDLIQERFDRSIEMMAVPADLKIVIIEGLENLTLGSALLHQCRMRRQPAERKPGRRLRHLDAAIEANTRSEEEAFAETVRRFLSAF